MGRLFLRLGPIRALALILVPVVAASAAGWWAFGDARDHGDASQGGRFALLSTYDPEQVYTPDERWQKVADPEAMGWSSTRLAEARRYSESLDTSGVVIVDNGVVVEAWGNLGKRYQSRSMRKSYLSVLFGVAVADGRIRLSDTLEQLGIDDEPPLTAEERKATVADLLTARSGVYHAANFESRSMRRKRPDRGSHPPGTFWYYNNWDFNALGTIFERATGEGIFDAFQRHIAAPLQMQDYRVADTRYHEGKHSIHPAYRFRMSPLDLARLGLLYLRRGDWNGRQVIPASWVEDSTRAHVDTGRIGFYAGYGYMWWVGADGYAAVGSDGQRMFVMPERGLVVVHVVDSDDKELKVRSKAIRPLLHKIIDAKEAG